MGLAFSEGYQGAHPAPPPTHSGYGDLPWRHDHWAVIFEDVPSGLLHPFHDLKDGWKDSLVVSTREQFLSASGGKSLSEVCVEAVKKYGAPYYVTTGELVSYLRTDIGGKSNWSVGVKDWPEREVLGQDCGGKTTFVKWHRTTSWAKGDFTPPLGKLVGGRSMSDLFEVAIASSPFKELSAKGVTGYIKGVYPST